MTNMLHTIFAHPYKKYFLALLTIFVVSVALRSYNLNYNSPHNDEADKIVIGRMGLFQWDWWTYNSSAWLGGSPYIYPVLTALAYTTGGIVGSRLLNVLFGALTLEVVFMLTYELSPGRKSYRYGAGIIAALIMAFTPISYYVSRLATYDMPSFYFFMTSIAVLCIAQQAKRNAGKYYFFASVLLILAFLTKYVIAVYIPLLLVYSYAIARHHDKKYQRYWFRYYVMPLFLIGGVYLYATYETFLQFSMLQATKDKSALMEIVGMLWFNDPLVWILWVAGSVGMFLKKQLKLWAGLTVCSLWIVLPHLLSQRALLTLEKQTYLTVAFIAPIIGIGIMNIISIIPRKSIQYMLVGGMVCILFIYCGISYRDSQRFNIMWSNGTPMLQTLEKTVQTDDKVLAEVGAAAILATYEKNYPLNTATFDWFEHEGQSGEKAYVVAVKEGYFNVIELEIEKYHEEAGQRRIYRSILSSIDQNYTRVYEENGYFIYKRTF
ncbi:MAG: hypothetical protein RI947_823 [Candidatus Parcubacteria bacterium]